MEYGGHVGMLKKTKGIHTHVSIYIYTSKWLCHHNNYIDVVDTSDDASIDELTCHFC